VSFDLEQTTTGNQDQDKKLMQLMLYFIARLYSSSPDYR
jgi:hypothetical protein